MKPIDSAGPKTEEHHGLFEVKCKICRIVSGWSEHERMNMYICHDCGVWYHRERFRQKKLPRNTLHT